MYSTFYKKHHKSGFLAVAQVFDMYLCKVFYSLKHL